MKKLSSRRNLIILGIILVSLAVANIIIFVPYFLNGKQMLTSEELRQQQQLLADSARQASLITGKEANRSREPEELSAELKPIEKTVDGVVLSLRTTPHPVDLDEELRETLRLAEVLSFTLRTVAVEGAGDSLMATKTSQILQQSAQGVEQLRQSYNQSQSD